MKNRDDLSWSEKLSIAWDVFLHIFAWITVVIFVAAAIFGVGAFLFCLLTGKL